MRATQLDHRLADVVLTVSELAALQELIGLEELPVALQVPLVGPGSHHLAGLENRGLLSDGYVHRELAAWLRVLSAADHLVSARKTGSHEPGRMVVAWSQLSASPIAAERAGDTIHITRVTGASTAPLRRFLGRAPAIPSKDFRIPRRALLEALQLSGDVLATAAALKQLGLPSREAHLYAAALAHPLGMTEIAAGPRGAHTLTAGVFDSRHGRFLTVPARSRNMEWLTLCSGSDAHTSVLLERMSTVRAA